MHQLKTHVDQTLKHAFTELAKNRNMSEAALLRELVLTAISKQLSDNQAPPTADRQPSSITVYLPRFLKKLAEQRARAKALTTSSWVVSLLQSNLTSHPVMSHNQLASLNASVRELASIGRNVNQIAKALNQRPGDVGLNQTELLSLRDEIRDHQHAVRELVKVSERSWSSTLRA